jgi:hypothetical protein
MSLGAASSARQDWRSAVTVRIDSDLGAEFTHRLATTSGERSLGVTDLLATRRAFWRHTSPPIPLSTERQARVDAGRWWHQVVGSAIAPGALLEVRVRKAGVAGRIDALTDRPIEVKTASFALDPSELVSDRPDHVEQLGMYCALVGQPTGRLVTVVGQYPGVSEVRTTDIQFRDLGRMSAEMERRAVELRNALTQGRPDGLPRCRWFDRGCEFQSTGVCDCTGSEPDLPSVLLESVASLEARPEVDRELMSRLSEALASRRLPSILRFRELVYPRRAYFERTELTPPPEEEPPPERAPTSDLFGRLIEAVESGPVGEVYRLPYRSDAPEEEVAAFRGTPYLVRTSRAWAAPRAEEILERFPQYALELGFRCVTTGTRSARVLLGFERADSAEQRLKVYALDFSPVTVFARLFREGVASFERALRDQTPAALAACPGWMYDDCPYRARCGCGSETGRSQR